MDLVILFKFLEIFAWMPPVLRVLVGAAVALFLIWAFLRILAIIMDIIPFL